MSDPRDEETVRRWQEYTRSGAPDPEAPATGLPVVVTDDPVEERPPDRAAPSAMALAVLGLAVILLVAVGGFLFLNGPGGGSITAAKPPVNGRPVDVPQSGGKAAPSRDLIIGRPAAVQVDASAPQQMGLGQEAGRWISSDFVLMVDGDPATAWRVHGDGTGQNVIVRLGQDHAGDIPTAKTVTQVGLVNGFAKGEHYRDGRKILAVRWDFGNGQILNQTFKDSQEPQLVTLPHALSTDRVEMTITEVGTAATNYDDYTAVGELLVRGY